MNSRLFAMTVPALLATSFFACSSAPVDETTELNTATSAVTSCPTAGSSEAQQRAAADLAFNLMRLAAKQGGAVAPCYANTILAPHRYVVKSSGTGIDFRSTDSLLTRTNSSGQKCVTDEMKAILALAQQDTALATYLSDGQKQAYKTNGAWFPSVESVQALANFTGPTLNTTIADVNAIGTHNVTVSSSAWCNSDKILFTESVKTYQGFAPLRKQYPSRPAGTNPQANDPQNWQPTNYNAYGMGFTGSIDNPWSPFWGASGNPYMVISVNGSAGVAWNAYNWSPNYNCGQTACTGTLEFDPAPYAEPSAYYVPDNTGQQILMGTQANPFTIAGTQWSAKEHKCEYANFGTYLGRFATYRAMTVGTSTVIQYGWVKNELVANVVYPANAVVDGVAVGGQLVCPNP